jgi:hypothetical protein
VSGRGPVPAIRIGSQPYGIIPTTAFARLRWPDRDRPAADGAFLTRLHAALSRARRDWAVVAKSVPHVGQPGDPHQTLLAILGLDASSVEFDQRYAETQDLEHNLLALANPTLLARRARLSDDLVDAARRLLGELGWTGPLPEILEKPFFGRSIDLNGPPVDDRPLSETAQVRPYTTDGRNYIVWLRDAASTSLDALRTEDGFPAGGSPIALLYLLLKHALERAYEHTGRRLLHEGGVLDTSAYLHSRLESPFVHVRGDVQASDSRWRALYEPAAQVSGDTLLHRFITDSLGELRGRSQLPEQLDALALLDVPTARLERALAEHIDCCSFRLDAWLLGLAHHRLETMRTAGGRHLDGGAGTNRGVYVGAYAWLENVVPEPKELRPAPPGPDLDGFPDGPPPMVDPTNAGYALAPSLDHAVTAAVLRNGYLSNATPTTAGTLAVNLSSERVRVALELVQGLRNGQPLGALLGYRLERGLHDRHELPALNSVIYSLRSAFPLVANRTTTTEAPPGTAIEAIDARNVIDGLRLVEQVRSSERTAYPFGVPSLPPLDTPLRDAVTAEVARLLDAHDALADLALAEGVYQAVQGNFERAAATLDAFSKASFPPIPDVVATPRSGLPLTHRVAVHVDPAATAQPGWTPRARSEPALNAWLATVVPPPSQIACRVSYVDPAGLGHDVTVTQAQLGLQPLDLLHVLSLADEQAMTSLDDLIVDHVVTTRALRPDVVVRIRYMEPLTGQVTFFELAALVRNLRAVLLAARPLEPTDLVAPGAGATEGPRPGDAGTVDLDPARVADRLTELGPHATALGTVVSQLEADIAAGNEIANFEARVAALLTEARFLARYGLPAASIGAILDRRRAAFAAVVEVARELVARWRQRLDDFDDQLSEYGTLPPGTPDDERFARLQAAERLVSTVAELPLTTPAALEAAVTAKRAPFANRLTMFEAVVSTASTNVATALAELEAARDAAPPLSELDATELPVERAATAVRTAAADITALARALRDELDDRSVRAQQRLTAAASAGSDADRVSAVQEAARILFGDEFRLLPTVTLAVRPGGEFALAWADRDELLRHLRDDVQLDEPVEDWLHGVARVRERLHALEAVLVVSDALRRRAGVPPQTPRTLTLRPVQLPRDPEAHWLALQYPATSAPSGEHLLYTATYAVDVTAASAHCGLLVDDWVEVVPAPDINAGLTFHFDRPSTEPPQSWLLVTPADLNGSWDWTELVDAVRETFELARLRAVEPDLLDRTPYAALLPAIVLPALTYQISLSANLAVNNRVYERFPG